MLHPLLIGAATILLLLVAYLKLKPKPAPALTSDYKKYRIRKQAQITHNVMLFRIFFEHPDQVLGLPIGHHVRLRFTENGKQVIRSYTPVSLANQKGYCDLIIKIYDDGQMSQHLANLPDGEGFIDMKHALCRLQYLGGGRFSIKRGAQEEVRTFQNVGMLAGGSGLTPMLQIMRAVSEDPRDLTNVNLIFANQEERDIVQQEELVGLQEKFANIKTYFNLDRPPAGWAGGSGFVTAKTLEAADFPEMGDDTLVLVCGPPPMCGAMERMLTSIGCSEKNYFIF